MNEITSRDNQWVKMACSLKQKKGRQAHQRVFVEGLRVIADAAAMAIPDAICFVSEKGRALDGFEALYARGLELGWTFYAVTDSVYDKLKDTRTPQGLAAMLPFFAYTFDSLPAIAPEKAVLYLRSIQDPGNLGTILRTAAAANAGAEGQADQMSFSFSGAQLPFRISHAVGVVFHVYGQSAGGLEHVPYRNVVPAGHVGKRINGPLVKIDEPRHSHADGLHFRMIQPQHIHELGYGFNQLIGIAIFLGGY